MEAQLKPVTLNQYFELSKTDLKQFLDIVKPSAKKQLALATIVLSVKKSRLVLQYRDNKIFVEKYMGAYGYNPQFSVLVGYKDFLKDIEQCTDERVCLHWDSDRLYSDTFNTRHTSRISTDVTVMADIDYATKKFPSLMLLEALPRVIKIIDDNSPRGYGTIARFYVKENIMGIVATDSFGLSISEYPRGGCDYAFLHDVKLSKSQCEQLLIAAKSGQEISLGESDDKTILLAKFGEYKIHFRTSLVKYPNYETVIPKARLGSQFDVKDILKLAKTNIELSGEGKVKAKIVNLKNCFNIDYPIWVDAKYLIDALTATKANRGMLCVTPEQWKHGEYAPNPKFGTEPIKLIVGSVSNIIVPIAICR